MNFNDVDEIKKAKFIGFRSINELYNDDSLVPKSPGVYLVLNLTKQKDFLEKGTGGYFKGKEPNVSLAELDANWI